MAGGLLRATLAICAICLVGEATLAQAPRDQRNKGVLRVRTLGNALVQKELKLNPGQIAKFAALEKQINAAMAGGVANFNAPGGFEQMLAQMGQLNAHALQMLDETLSETQHTRFVEIMWQMPTGHGDAVLHEKLGLTDEQRDQVEKLGLAYDTRRDASASTAPRNESAAQRRERMTKLLAEHNAELNELLTETQREELVKLQGKPFDCASILAPKPSTAPAKGKAKGKKVK